MASSVPPPRNVAFTDAMFLQDQNNTRVFKLTPTLAAGDVKVSKDFGTYNNITTLPVETPSGSGQLKVDLSATEMDADLVCVRFIDAAGAEWCDGAMTIKTCARRVDDLAYPATAGRSLDVDTAGAVAKKPTVTSAVNDAAASTTEFVTDLTESANDYWKDSFLRITSGALINQVKKITAYNGTTKKITVQGGFTAAPADNVTFEIVNQ